MRNRIASAYKNPAVRFIAIALLAGTAAGCSSDATRFDSFYHSADNISTGSIQGGGSGRVPTPSADIASAGNLPPRSDLSDSMGQPLPPAQDNGQYGSPLPVSSNARVVSSSPVQSAALGAPLPPAAPAAAPAPVRQAANSAAPAKAHTNIRMVKGPDPISTGTVPASQPSPNKQVASVEPKVAEQAKPGKVPVPAKGPKQEAVLPSTPQPERKKVAAAEAKDGAKGNTHKVASGESLIAIAKKDGVTVEALRAANGLTSNAVRAGQELKIPAAGAVAPKVAEKPATEKVTADDMTTASVSGKPEAPLKPKADQSAAAPAAASAASAASKESVSKASETQVASTTPAETGIGKYRWPATGAVIAAYGANVDGQRNDGIDISVPEGTPVKAAENGVVIYAGNGLEKLGNTVLIRHSDGKVTVYAHLKSIDVTRGDKVNRGQVVADSGMSGSASRPKLHFEVRKNSAPINPMSFLE